MQLTVSEYLVLVVDQTVVQSREVPWMGERERRENKN